MIIIDMDQDKCQNTEETKNETDETEVESTVLKSSKEITKNNFYTKAQAFAWKKKANGD